MKLNDKIRQLRKSRGMSQEDLANKINVSRQSVSKWELGDTIPEVNKILEIANIFNVTTDYLLQDDRLKEPLKNTDIKNLEEITKDPNEITKFHSLLDSKNIIKKTKVKSLIFIYVSLFLNILYILIKIFDLFAIDYSITIGLVIYSIVLVPIILIKKEKGLTFTDQFIYILIGFALFIPLGIFELL